MSLYACPKCGSQDLIEYEEEWMCQGCEKTLDKWEVEDLETLEDDDDDDEEDQDDE